MWEWVQLLHKDCHALKPYWLAATIPPKIENGPIVDIQPGIWSPATESDVFLGFFITPQPLLEVFSYLHPVQCLTMWPTRPRRCSHQMMRLSSSRNTCHSFILPFRQTLLFEQRTPTPFFKQTLLFGTSAMKSLIQQASLVGRESNGTMSCDQGLIYVHLSRKSMI
jgi:hypothetical protein